MHKLNLTVITLAATVALAGCASSAAGTSGGSTKPASGISKGLGAKDASADVAVGKGAKDPDLGWVSAPVKITNHSSKRSDYFIDLAIESADGSTQYDTTMVMAEAVEPGQSAIEKGQFTKDGIPATAKIVVKSVQRTASN